MEWKVRIGDYRMNPKVVKAGTDFFLVTEEDGYVYLRSKNFDRLATASEVRQEAERIIREANRPSVEVGGPPLIGQVGGVYQQEGDGPWHAWLQPEPSEIAVEADPAVVVLASVPVPWAPKALDLIVEVPDEVSTEEAADVVGELVGAIDRLYRARGGHGLKLDQLKAEQSSEVPA